MNGVNRSRQIWLQTTEQSSVSHREKLCVINAPIKGHHVYQTNYPVGTRFQCFQDPKNRHSDTVVVVKKADSIVGHVPERSLSVFLQHSWDFPAVSVDCISTGLPRAASQGTWTVGGGIVIPAKYIIFGKKERKKEIHLQVKKALAKLELWMG